MLACLLIYSCKTFDSDLMKYCWAGPLLNFFQYEEQSWAGHLGLLPLLFLWMQKPFSFSPSFFSFCLLDLRQTAGQHSSLTIFSFILFLWIGLHPNWASSSGSFSSGMGFSFKKNLGNIIVVFFVNWALGNAFGPQL